MIYLDYQATTPLAPEAREAMIRQLDGPDGTSFGNPHSPHRLGRQAAAAIEAAREKVAALFPSGGRVIFTGGATEALNLAIRGTVGKGAGAGAVAFSAIEHSAVGDTARAAGAHELLPVTPEGICDPSQNLPANARMIAIMQVNNEIGTRQPVEQWASRARDAGALMLVDGVQAYGKMALPDADMIAISGHKFHGPKGVGALWLRDGVELREQQTGGGQEFGLRSGTLSPALIAGMGAAAAMAEERQEEDAAHVEALWERARDLFEDWTLNGSAEHRWHGNLNIRKDGLDVARLMSDVRTVMFSAGSACASGSGRPSHVLKAIGLSNAEAKSSIRLGFGRYTTMEELEEAAQSINNAMHQQAAWG
ncbi:MAG: aminotransferase class V-fold PLP-dependent enzyme [Pseudomonadota bacterium]